MAPNDEELEDLTTCGVCFMEYDDNLHKPKFLQCFHTVCLQCLQLICKEGHILCPICRDLTPCPKGVSQLRNNPHAIHMVELRKKLDISSKEKSWCLTCASLAEAKCTESHEIIDIPLREPSGGRILQSAVDQYKLTLAQAIDKRRGLQTHFQEICCAIKSFEDAVQRQSEENELRLAELMSALDSADKKSGSSETFQSMRSRIEASNTKQGKELLTLNDDLHVLEKEKNVRLRIHLETLDKQKVATLPLFENGFCKSGDDVDAVDRQDVFLLSSVIFSVLKRRSVALKPQTPARTPEQPKISPVPVSEPCSSHPGSFQSTNHRNARRKCKQFGARATQSNETEGTDRRIPSTIPKRLTKSETFDPKHSFFILKIMDKGTWIGDVHVKPSADFDEIFLKHLADHCCDLAPFKSRVIKAVPESHVTLNFVHDEFRCPVPTFSTVKPDKALAVGLTRLLTQNDQVLQWDLLFLLHRFQSNNVASSCLFGHIVHGEQVITSLSRKAYCEGRQFSVVWQVG